MLKARASGTWLVGSLVPAVFALSMLAPEQGNLPLGIPEALGCSGTGSGYTAPIAAPNPRWYSVRPAEIAADPSVPIPVATDGFVVFLSYYVDMTADEALASLEFVVSDAGGNVVPGKLAFVNEKLTWSADAPLAIGAQLTASLSALHTVDAAATSGQYSLAVVGPRPALPSPSVLFSHWQDQYSGTGPMVDCGAPASSCTGPSLASTVYDLIGGTVLLDTALQLQSGVLWEVTISPSAAGATEGQVSAGSALVLGPLTATGPLGSSAFDVDAKEVCVTAKIKDLRDGKEVSSEVCHAVEANKGAWAGSLSSCAHPPTEALRELWCRARTTLGLRCDSASGEPGVVVPNEGTVGNGTPGDGSAAPNAAAETPHESSGCQLAGPSKGSASALASALAALAIALLKRRRSHRQTLSH